MLNALTGRIIYKIPTGVGDANTPSGLAQINNFVDKALINNTTVRVYGTDMMGNIWRFDVNDNTPPAGREATLVGTATDAGGTPQPITIRPELTQLGSQPMLFVGTGSLLGATDVGDLQTQSIYGIVDPVVGPATAYPNLRTLAGAADHDAGRQRPGRVSHDRLRRHHRAVLDDQRLARRPARPAASASTCRCSCAPSTLVVGSNVPQSNACSVGGYSWLNYLNYSSGLAVSSSPQLAVSEEVANSLIVGLTIIQVSDQSKKAIITTADAGVLVRSVPTSTRTTEPQTRQLARNRGPVTGEAATTSLVRLAPPARARAKLRRARQTRPARACRGAGDLARRPCSARRRTVVPHRRRREAAAGAADDRRPAFCKPTGPKRRHPKSPRRRPAPKPPLRLKRLVPSRRRQPRNRPRSPQRSAPPGQRPERDRCRAARS